jgi:hypothetical protein
VRRYGLEPCLIIKPGSGVGYGERRFAIMQVISFETVSLQFSDLRIFSASKPCVEKNRPRNAPSSPSCARPGDRESVIDRERRGWDGSKDGAANGTPEEQRCSRRPSVELPMENGHHEPYESRDSRTVLWAAGGEIPPADPATIGAF